jgi:hypothetical protein
MAVAAVALLLGGTYQSQQQRKPLEQKTGNKPGSQSAVTPVETTIAKPSLVPMNPSNFSVLPTISGNKPDGRDSVGTELPNTHNLLEDFLAGIKSTFDPGSDAIHSHTEPLRRQAVKNPISSQSFQPRNVMISRMRSIKGRGLHEKYKVDWNTVLGEGAYGSVHPARLALTGEKVALKKISKRYTNSSDFFSETDALLRIYDNGGHPNISGLRDMVSEH